MKTSFHKFSIAVLFFLSVQRTFGQTYNTDSLITVIQSSAADTNQVNKIIDLCYLLNDQSEFDKMVEFAKQGVALAQQLHFRSRESSAYQLAGLGYTRMGNLDLGIENYEKALTIDRELGDKSGIAGTLNNIGLAYNEKSNFPQALAAFYEALKINEETDNKEWIVGNQNNIAICYLIQEKYDKALEMLFDAIKQFDKIGNPPQRHHPYNNIGNCYYGMERYEDALIYFKKALDIRLEVNDILEVGMSYGNVGSCELELGRTDDALEHFMKALRIANETGNEYLRSSVYVNIGYLLMKKSKYRDASTYLDSGYVIAKELQDYYVLMDYHDHMSELDSIKGDYLGSLYHYKLSEQFSDSVVNEKSKEQLLQNQMQYDFDKKETATRAEQDKKDALALEELQKQKLVRNGFIGGFALVLGFAGVFFAQRNRIKKGKKRSDELLLNILPEEVAEELKAKGSTDAQLIEHVSVLFTDFKGFTSMSEKLSPKELVADLHECFSAFDRITEKYRLEKIKTIGDAYMAAGGLPTPNNTHASDAIKAAMEMRDFIDEGKQRKIALELPYFEIRIGIHTGPVVAGIVGVKKFQYDIWGDTVNTASRMESSGEVGQINISETTYALVKDEFVCSPRGKVQAKGKGEMEMYFVG